MGSEATIYASSSDHCHDLTHTREPIETYSPEASLQGFTDRRSVGHELPEPAMLRLPFRVPSDLLGVQPTVLASQTQRPIFACVVTEALIALQSSGLARDRK